MAQKQNDYSANWKKVEALEKKGLTKSALQEVLAIYKLALKENNDAQQIKSCIYQVRYRNMVEEDSHEKNILFIDTLIAKAKAPAKNILQSMQAQLFWQYLQNNRYKFYNRTKLADEKSTDISTWSLDKLHATISALYKSSLQNEALIKQTKLEGLEAIIIKGENTRHLRPTLYDFLAHRTLQYFMNDERNLIKPAYHFTINNDSAFFPASEFVKVSFATKDSASLQHQALLLFQSLIKFHLKDAQKDALLDIDLKRLSYANQYAVIENKSKLYENALKNIEAAYPGNPGVAQALHLRAMLYFDRGQQYSPFQNKDAQYEIKRARDFCEEAIKKYPGAEGAANCKNLLNQILQPSLSLQTEKVNIPGQPFRTLVNYKNIPAVYFRIVKTSKEEIEKLNKTNYDKIWKEVINMKHLKTWSVALPDLQDYQNHAVEIKVDALESGTYFLLASINENFSLEKNIIARQLTYVSSISYIHNNNSEYYVVHRDNGQPLANTFVQVWENKYNYTKNENAATKAESYTTDKNGLFTLKKTKEYRNFALQLKTKEDELFLTDENYGSYYNSYEEDIKPVTFLFTDRSIYRPGQTIYFKGIVLKKNKNAAETVPFASFNSSIQLKDANGQKLADLKLTANTYGSYNGSFKLPEGLLNGQFSVFDETTNSSQYFSVEEYKRPKFMVEVKKPSGTYRLLDSISVSGTAKAYAGNNIDGAVVKYRVVRKVRYQPWWYNNYGSYRGKIFPPGRPSEEMEITNGVSATDGNGAFEITFKALPDETVDKKDQPVFYYEVIADVTDLNGETRSGNTSVAVSYQMVQLAIEVPSKLSVDSLKKMLIKSTNLNDIEERVNASVSIQRLTQPGKIFRERYWEQPDQFVMSKDEYYGYFPHDIYSDENEVKNYAPAEKVLERTDSTNVNWQIESGKWKAGWYKIVATAKDKNGEEVRTEKYIQLTDDNSTNENEPVIVHLKKPAAQPGEKITYDIKTGFRNIWLIHTLSKMDKSINTSYQTIKSTQPFTNEIEIKEADRGGMDVSYVFVQHNRVYKGNESVDIAWSNKDLNISYQTFRDKTLPGSKEKWTVKITGNKGEKVAAEMLAGMYDASLDQFKPHNWSALNIWPKLNNTVNWTANGFSANNSEGYNGRNYEYVETKPKSYDGLLGFEAIDGIHFLEGRVAGIATRNAAPMQAVALAKNADIRQEKFTPPKIVKDEELEEDKSMESDTTFAVDNKTKVGNYDVQIRKNFNETAFFFPDLKTDADGNVSFEFTIPEAITEWKLMTFAHTKELASGYTEKKVITQKPLMVQPNAPRFMREGDRMELSSKLVNLSDKEITGTAQLQLLDAATNNPVDGWFKNVFANQYFTVAAGQSIAVRFPMEIPFNFNSALTYRVIAKSESFSDGEEAALPILTNRVLVTETMPLNLRNTNHKDFKFEKLLNSGKSTSIKPHALTVEFTSNPVWYAVQALPSLMETENECSEQVFNRFYANVLAGYVSNSMPKIKAVFEKWKNLDTAALLSNLQKNEELKSALLQETPWVLDAQNENEQKKRIALLFDMVKMSSETAKAINKLTELQNPNGAFVWFKGGLDDRYMTQYIITGIGHLRKLNALSDKDFNKVKPLVNKALGYLDKKIKDEYDNLVKYKVNLSKNNLSHTAIQYLYMRSLLKDQPIAPASQTAFKYFREQTKKYWLSNNKYMQAMIALSLYHTDEKAIPVAIIKSLKENAINKEETGMYWKESSTGGYYWHQAAIETQSLLIEAFTDIDKNANTIDDLKTWLLKQKQTQNWKTSKATADACYALLLGGNNWLTVEKEVEIKVGNTIMKSTDAKKEAGTGYFKNRIEGDKVKPEMGNISVTVGSTSGSTVSSPGNGTTSWGAVYWQYFEDMDKVTTATSPLKISKQLFVETNTDKGPVLKMMADGNNLKVGDKVKVRLEVKVDRDMEYIHLKDMRAACMEPVNVFSGYKYQAGVGYYESTKDASTNFFFNLLPRGTHVFEYAMFVTHNGSFSNGITTIQCMYAPEFKSNSEGIRVNVEGDKK